VSHLSDTVAADEVLAEGVAMSSLAGRTAYVLLAAVEEDLRGLVERFAGDDPVDVLGSELVQRTKDRRRRDGFAGSVTHLEQALPYLDFQDSYDLALRIKDRLPSELRDGLKSIHDRIAAVVPIRNRVAHNRPMEIDDLPNIADLTAELEAIEGFDWPAIRLARNEVKANPAFVFSTAASLIVEPAVAVANNLPSPDFDETSLLGRRDERRQIARALRGAWPVVSILGDGGIGKTALALQVCYDLIGDPDCPFEAVVWVTAKNAQLTSTEILRIESAVEDSLGLFASAAAAVGETGKTSTAVEDVLDVLSSFPTLLVLDNIETVLDENFHTLLREIPTGSKVLITSRIGVKTENPFRLTGLNVDDAKRLVRILGRVRNVGLLASVEEEALGEWVRRMSCHPAYIKWFVAGVQAGQVPEQLLAENGLVLDFCMSNVFDYLGDDARTALGAMLVVPGSHTLAELAFLTEFDAGRVQAAVLELTRTNFVTQVRGGASGSALELSDFARAYLRRTLDVDAARRSRLRDKQRQLYALGGGLQAAHARDPYAPDTIDVRGVGDYSAARMLRDALDAAAFSEFDEALAHCSEAAELAPGYHEAARIEGYIHELNTNFGEAFEAYSRAKDLAPNSPYVAYFLGTFLVSSGFDPYLGLQELQRAANLDPQSALVQLAISDAHLALESPRSAMDAAIYAIQNSTELTTVRRDGTFAFLRACSVSVRAHSSKEEWSQVAEDAEIVVEHLESVDPRDYTSEALDLCLLIETAVREGAAESSDDFIAGRLAEQATWLREVRRRSNADHLERRLGTVQNVLDRGFGFLRSNGQEFYFHATSLWDRRYFDSLSIGAILAFRPGVARQGGKTPAEEIYWVA
jgi:LuxR family transcriptional regulator, glucitol operon activator